MDRNRKLAEKLLLFLGFIFILLAISGFLWTAFGAVRDHNSSNNLDIVYWGLGILFAAGLIFILLVLLPSLGFNFKKIGWEKGPVIDVEYLPAELPEVIAPKEIPQEEKQEKYQYAIDYAKQNNTVLPGQHASDFKVLDEKLALTVTPCSDPMIPMYMLDRFFRVIDWNTAFNLCFDRTLEGRRGYSILEWTYFLDNYEDVLRHGTEVFAEGKKWPRIDIEPIEFTSDQYGKIIGTKRAYQIPDDDSNCLGWLIIIVPKFEDDDKAHQYQADLFFALRQSLIWSEYALCYDKVLNNSLIYPELIQTLLGNRQPGPSPIPNSSTILDVGAGTGNITFSLAQNSNRLIVAVDNNPLMLSSLRRKCQPYLRQDANGPGVVAVKQDLASFYGLNEEFFDYVVINNVLYSLDKDTALSCLKSVWRLLKPGGEIRLSEPQKSTDLDKVIDQVQMDLQSTNKYAELENDFLKLKQINQISLKPYLHRWSLAEMENILLQNFAEITYKTDNIYAGQSMLICARK